MEKIFPLIALIVLLPCSCGTNQVADLTPRLRISESGRFISTDKNDPFFWLGDTGWLIFMKLNREETENYLEIRRLQGFNVIQAMVLHDVRNAVNSYGDTAIVNNQVDNTLTTPGNSFEDPLQYDFWDHIDWVTDLAASKGLYMALVPVWGSNVKAGYVTSKQAADYGNWIANRYKNKPNVIWLNGGDVRGDDSTAVWNALGSAIKKISPDQLITFHPFGRTQSSTWFHNEPWLDFNMFQSGHRRYDQDTTGLAYGEDNWRYASEDYSKIPVKPTLDGEPSYEGIPQGLHDTTQPYWTDIDVRRYAYWSVFAGCCGFTYGHSSIMQFYETTDNNPAYGAKQYWNDAINAPGARQMKHLKNLIVSKQFSESSSANDMLAEPQGEKYDYIAIIRGADYLFAYTCNGRHFSLQMENLPEGKYNSSWYDPRTGISTPGNVYNNKGIVSFNPPGETESGNDWVLILSKI